MNFDYYSFMVKFNIVKYLLIITILFSFVFSQSNDILTKSVYANEIFSIKVYTEVSNELYIVSGLNFLHLSNTDTKTIPGAVTFSFKALKEGQTMLTIDKINKTIKKNWIQYKINILPSKEKVINNNANIRRVAIKKKEEENRQYTLIKKLYDDNQYDTALKHINDYQKKNRTGSYLLRVTLLKVSILTNKGSFEDASTELNNYLKKNGKKLTKQTKIKTMLFSVDIDLAAGETNNALDTLYQASSLADEIKLQSKVLLKLADTLYLTGHLSQALNHYISFYEKHKKNKNSFEIDGLDRAIFRTAEIYETETKVMDMQNAFKCYNLLPQLCPYSELLELASQRATYLKNHFLDIK